MPYKKEYSSKTVKMSNSGYMGSQGTSVTIKPAYNKMKATKKTKFTA
jgi:hypothetical protein